MSEKSTKAESTEPASSYCQTCFWTQPSWRRRICLPAVIVAIIITVLAACGGLFYLHLQQDKCVKVRLAEATSTLKLFESFLANDQKNIQPQAPPVQSLAQSLGSSEKIYSYVTEEIRFEPRDSKNLAALDVIENKFANCAGKANLICSLLLANGVKADHCHVTIGVLGDKQIVHAWVEFKDGQKWIVLDSTTTLGRPWIMERNPYYNQFKVRPIYEYNNAYAQYCSEVK